MHAGLYDRVYLTGHRQNQRGFAATIRPKNCDVLSGTDRQIDAMEHYPIAPGNVDVSQLEKLIFVDSPSRFHMAMLHPAFFVRLN
jgi:hypothetical protein